MEKKISKLVNQQISQSGLCGGGTHLKSEGFILFSCFITVEHVLKSIALSSEEHSILTMQQPDTSPGLNGNNNNKKSLFINLHFNLALEK